MANYRALVRTQRSGGGRRSDATGIRLHQGNRKGHEPMVPPGRAPWPSRPCGIPEEALTQVVTVTWHGSAVVPDILWPSNACV